MTAGTRKLQVFVSSTYTDLREERQAAVEAILLAGHIPAGMELFAEGDKEQMDVIRQWIDESDVFMLILAGRYGSIEPDSGLSYTHLEYEYATKRKIPRFTCVIDEDELVKRIERPGGYHLSESLHPDKLRAFRKQVTERRSTDFWSDHKDIRLAIQKQLSTLSANPDLRGWIRPSGLNVEILADEIARLSKENAQLRLELSEQKLSSEQSSNVFKWKEAMDELERNELVHISKELRENVFVFVATQVDELFQTGNGAQIDEGIEDLHRGLSKFKPPLRRWASFLRLMMLEDRSRIASQFDDNAPESIATKIFNAYILPEHVKTIAVLLGRDENAQHIVEDLEWLGLFSGFVNDPTVYSEHYQRLVGHE